jgi:hypothetical protein
VAQLQQEIRLVGERKRQFDSRSASANLSLGLVNGLSQLNFAKESTLLILGPGCPDLEIYQTGYQKNS